MRAKEAAEKLGITQRMLRHYEKAGLLNIERADNGYRSYTATDLRRIERIRSFIAIGFSTREVLSMSACLSDEGAGPCEEGIGLMLEKLKHIDQLRADLDRRRNAIVDHISALQKALEVKS